MNNLKNYFFIIIILSLAIGLNAQNWKKLLPPKNSSELTLFDYQKAFYDYWSPYNVKNGYYNDQNGKKIKAAGWKQFKRWEWFWEQRVSPETGKFPEFNAIDMQFRYYNPPLELPSGLNSASWSNLGTNSSTSGYAGIGRLNCIAFHPSNNNTFWVGAASGGIWKTTDGGSSWTVLNDGTGVLAVSDIIVPSDYASSNTLYIATGDKDHWDNRSIGVLKSTDGGSTWNATGLAYSASQGKMVFGLLIDPTNNQTLLATTNDGVYKTTNGGTTWNTLLTNIPFIDLEYKPNDFNTLYGSTTSGEIYVSTNGGANWTKTLDIADGYRIEMAVSPNQAGWIYAVVANADSGLYGIYKSTDSGATFIQVFDGAIKNLLGWDSAGGGTGGQGWYDLSLAASNSNANTLLVGGVNTWRSTDGGLNWSIVNHWWGDGVQAVHADKHKLIYRSNGDLYECNDGGVYISTNNGTNWDDKTNGLVISQMYKLGVAQTVNNEVITGLQDNGTKLYSSVNWTDVKGGDGMECLIDYSDINIQYGTYVNGQLDRTTNHWLTATDISANISGDNVGAWVTPYIIDPTNPSTLYAGYSDVWKTTNRGNTWTKISTMNFAQKIRAMAIAPSNNQVLYISDPYNIWKTNNGGTSWSNITTGLPVSWITYITVKHDDPNTVWITLSTYSGSSVYQSTNGGTSWTNISAGLPSIPVNCIIQNKAITSQVDLYVGTDNGVYYKKGSSNWTAFNSGLPNVIVSELDIYYNNVNPENSILNAASYGRGLWATPIMEDIVEVACNDLFISEYVEGTSNNKYIEIYNPTCEAVTLTGNYSLKLYYNGSSTAGATINLVGTIASKGVFIIAHNLHALSVTPNQTSASCNFNGDDAIELLKGTTTLDVIGQIGFDPGTEWGTGNTSTADNTLVRKPNVTVGDIVGSDVFDPSIQWLGFATNYIDSLGSHTITDGLCNSCCPLLNTVPENVTIQNSTCQSNCTVGGGTITAPQTNDCPIGSSLVYSIDNGLNWSTTLPVYDQDGPAQTIITRCQCDIDASIYSNSSNPITTAPGTCTNPASPVITIIDNDCPSTDGTISASGCASGTQLEWATNASGPWSTTTPTYTTTSFTVYARCRDLTTNCLSNVVSDQTQPITCSGDVTISNSGGPTVSDPCTCAGNGKFNEEVVVSSLTGETWSISANTNYLNPMTLLAFPVGTLLVENPSGSGQYTLVGVHMDDVGYFLSVTNGTVTLSISNKCWYPDPAITGLNDNYCENSPEVTLTGSAQLGDGSGPATAETESFTINGSTATVFNPANLGVGVHEIVYIFNAADDIPNDKHPGCIATDTLEITVNAIPDLTVSSNSPLCEGQNLQLTASGTGVDQWSWTGPNSFTSALQNPTINNVTMLAAGKYYVIGTITSTGCSTLDSTLVTINSNIVVTADSNSPLCEGDILTLNASGTGINQWSWTGPNGFSSSLQNPTINNVTLAAAGKYYVMGLITATGCYGSDSVTVEINPAPVPPTVQNITVCEGGSTLIVPTSTGGGISMVSNLFTWDFEGGITEGGVSQYPAIASNAPTQTVGAGISMVTQGAGSGCTAAVSASGFNIAPNNLLANAITSGDYFEFCVGSPVSPSTFNGVTAINWANRASGTGPINYVLVPSNNTSNILLSGTVAAGGTTCELEGGTFPLNTSTCYRIYYYGATNAGGTLRIDNLVMTASFTSPYSGGTFNFYSNSSLTTLLAGPTATYDPHTTTANSPQTIYVTQINTITGCESAAVPVVITVYAPPTADAGENQFYCGLPSSISISATGNYGGTWTSNGAGTIANPTSKNTTYTTNASDLGKTIIFTWTTITPQSACPNTSDIAGLTTVPTTASAEFSYNQDEYCPGSSDPTVSHVTGFNGIYTYNVLSDGPYLALNKNTGLITYAASDPGTYKVTNTVDGRGNLIITGVIDGPLSGGLPKAIELYAIKTITDLSRYGIESANNGNGSANAPEFIFPSVTVNAGTYIWIATESSQFTNFFGFAPTFINNVASINGDDAIVLYNDGQAIDVFGQVSYSSTIPTATLPWYYNNGWAYRKNNTINDGTVYNPTHWTFSGGGALTGATYNGTAAHPWTLSTFTTNLTYGCASNTYMDTIIIGDLILPTVICPQDIGVYLDPGDCDAYLWFNAPVATDNCGGDPIITHVSGPNPGDQLTLFGSPYHVVYEIYDANNNGPVTCSFDININGYPNPIVGLLACNDTVQVSLDENCELELNADMLLEGGPYQCYNLFQIYLNTPQFAGENVNNVPITLLPGTYTATVRDEANTNNSCNTVIVLKDKLAPKIDCNCPIGGQSVAGQELNGALVGQLSDKDLSINISNECYDFGGYGFLPESGNHRYDVYPFHVSTTGVYNISATSQFGSPIIGIYENYFNPSDICNYLLKGFGYYYYYYYQPSGSVILESGKKYYMLVSDYYSNAQGEYSILLNSDIGGHIYIDQAIYSENCVFANCYDENIVTPKPTVTEACDYTLVLKDSEVLAGPECGTQLLRQNWIVTDIGGNTAECTQEFLFKGANFADLIWPKNWDELTFNKPMLRCDQNFAKDPSGNPDPSFTGYPQGFDNNCGTIEIFYSDEVHDLVCGQKIVRTWTVVNDCSGEVVSHNQIIRITDDKAPSFMLPPSFKIATKAYECNNDVQVPQIMHLSDNCCADLKWWITSDKNYEYSGDTNKNGFVDNNETWTLLNVPLGIHKICYHAIDCCGNESEQCLLYEVFDGNPPIPVCEQYKQVSLTANGTARVLAGDFDSGSFDNCKDVFFKVLRVNNNLEYDNGCPNLNGDDQPGGSNQVWYDDEVYYCCEDIGKEIMTSLRVFEVDPKAGPVDPKRYQPGGDLYGHWNDCWSVVKIECKEPPLLDCPAVTVTCEESLDPKENTKLQPTVVYVCKLDDLSYIDQRDNAVCSANIVRTWTASACNKSTQCKQKITVTGATPFNPCTIQFPVDKSAQCASNLPDGGKPTWLENPCNVITAEIINEDTFKFVDGACMKILRDWAVIDWCVYEPNTGAENNIDPITASRKIACLDERFKEDGYYTYTQILMLVDTIKPQISVVNDECLATTDCFASNVERKATAKDECNDNKKFWWKYIVVNMDTWEAVQYSYNYTPVPITGWKQTKNTSLLNDVKEAKLILEVPIPIGNYRVTWVVGDGCGNATTEYQYFTIVDKKAPTPVLVDLNTAMMPNCMVEVCAIQFDKGGCPTECLSSFDNCTPKEGLYYTFSPILPKLNDNPVKWQNQYNIYGRYFYDPVTGEISTLEKYQFGEALAWDPDNHTACKIFGAGRNNTPPFPLNVLQVYVWDKFANNDNCDDNNYDYATVTLAINIGPDDGCPQPGSLVNGTVKSCINEEGIKDVTVKFTGTENSYYAESNATGSFGHSPSEGDYKITASKSINDIIGLTTLDLVLIQKHILNIKQANDICQYAAMDINNDEKVTASDVSMGRNRILGKIAAETNWNFMSEEYMNDHKDVTGYSLKDAYTLSKNIEKETYYNDVNFKGVIGGDVNFSANNTDYRNDNVVRLLIDEKYLSKGEEYLVPVYVESKLNVEGMQLALLSKNTQILNIDGSLMNIDNSNYNISRGAVEIMRMSWSTGNFITLAENKAMFFIKIKALQDVKLSDALQIKYDSDLKPEIYCKDENPSQLKLKVRNADTKFALYQNVPNPFSDKTEIVFDLSKDGDYTLTIIDVTGKEMKRITGVGEQGRNSIEIQNKELKNAGVYYYKVRSGADTQTMKMIYIK